MRAGGPASPLSGLAGPFASALSRERAPVPTGHTHGQVPSRRRPAAWPGIGPDGGAAVPGRSRHGTGILACDAGAPAGAGGRAGTAQRNLHFAGEHTSVDFQGYMEGAVRSGYRCAAEIAGRTPS
jgi:hypothetical protein